VKLTIRNATLDDLELLLDMMATFNRHERIEWAREQSADAVRRLLSDRELGRVGVAELDGSLAGYFVLTWGFDLEWNGRDAFLTELYLKPEVRGRRFGSALLRHIERQAREQGAAALHLMVRPENASAVRLYAAAGYVSPPRTFLTKTLRGG
jgi:ribosomal protein S18 acetylase RimI-like enzyme